MKLEDIKSGMFVRTNEDSDRSLHYVTEENDDLILLEVGSQSFLTLSDYAEDLKHTDGEEFDIIEILEMPLEPLRAIMNNWKELDWFEKRVRLLWSRDEKEEKKAAVVYVAHPISNSYEADASIWLAKQLRRKGYSVYAAAENKVINDKTASEPPTPAMIYQHDIEAIKRSDIFIVNLTGGHQDGTIMEVGFVSALNESLEAGNHIKVLAYSSNKRVMNPQFYQGIPSAHINHLVLGAIDKWGKMYGSLQELLDDL